MSLYLNYCYHDLCHTYISALFIFNCNYIIVYKIKWKTRTKNLYHLLVKWYFLYLCLCYKRNCLSKRVKKVHQTLQTKGVQADTKYTANAPHTDCKPNAIAHSAYVKMLQTKFNTHTYMYAHLDTQTPPFPTIKMHFGQNKGREG